MRVLQLDVSNFMRLEAVHVEPASGVVEVAGRNGQGKSTLLNAIKAVIGGAKELPEKPIRKGQRSAEIRIELGEGKPTLIARRTFNADEDGGGYKTQLFLDDGDGVPVSRPQTVLDALYGALTFDPFEWTRMEPSEQLDQLRSFVPDVDFAKIDGLNKRDFDERTNVNREIRQINARLAAMAVPGDPRQKRIDEIALVAELEQAGQTLAALEKERAQRATLLEHIRQHKTDADAALALRKELLDRAQELRDELAECEQRAEAALDRAAKITTHNEQLVADYEALPPIADAPDTSALRARIDTARKTNADVDARERVIQERERLAKSADEYEKKSKALTQAIEDRNAAKAAAIAEAKLPVEGLGFGDDQVLFNGLPFSQASSAEQLRVSVAITAALNRDLKIALVRDASLMDEDNMALVRELAEQHGLQLWLERVARDSATGIVIEDGRVLDKKVSDAAA